MMIERWAATIIALVAWTGLGVQFGATFAMTGNVGKTLWIMVLYFTIIGNIAVALAFTALAAGRSHRPSPFILGGVTITMLLVGIIYNTLLRGMVELSGGAKAADLLNHTVTPVLVSAFWFFLAERGRLRWSAPLKWALLPLAYFPYGLLRGWTGGRYPYPFMDLQELGWGRTLVNAIAIATCFTLLGYAMVWWDRRSLPTVRSLPS